MHRQTVKTPEEIRIMAEGGKMLAYVRQKVAEAAVPGVTTAQLDKLADDLIKKTGGEASFKLVEGYHHATCINVNDEVVHGIPGKRVLKDGDIVGIDVGLYYKGFHTDAAISVGVGTLSPERSKFLTVGKRTLQKTIEAVRPGKRISDLSEIMQKGVEGAGYSAVRALTGHGVGKELHEEPPIPCFVVGRKSFSPTIEAGMVLAIEIMYNEGDFEVIYKNEDGWTISTADGKISGLFEESVAVTKNGYEVLTKV